MDNDSDIGRIIVFVLIAIIYSLAAIVKKVKQWVEENKARQQQMRLPEDAAQRAPQVPPPSQPRDLPGSLLEELERKLRDFQESANRSETPIPQPYQQPSPPPQPARPQPQHQATMQPRRAMPRPYAAGRRAETSAMAMTAHKPAAPVIREAAVVSHRRLDHLAVLRNPSDIQRGIILNEILSSPLAMRRGIIPSFRRM